MRSASSYKTTPLGVLTLIIILPACCVGQEPEPQYEVQLQPVLEAKCGRCHNPRSLKGGLDLTTFAGARRGGESGKPAVADSIEGSLLWHRIERSEMPPKGQPQLSPEETGLIRRWLQSGAAAKRQRTLTQHDVLPYLYTRCVVCHGKRRQEGGLDLRTVASIRKGGKSGPAVVPGKPAESLLLKRVTAKEMPPPRELIRAGVRPLEPAEIKLLSTWISQGAREFDITPDIQTDRPDPLVSDEDRDFWSFRPPTAPPVPKTSGTNQPSNPIDAFLLRKLQQKGLNFAAKASRVTLVRRVAFDLTGLPPDWRDVHRFSTDPAPDWYSKMVDFYLASPHYGERWGRHWLDLCGYADSEGKRSADPIRPHAWRFRDYVIQSLNNDKPYDRFLLEQIAGDELIDFTSVGGGSQRDRDLLVATGFLRMAPDGTGSDIVDTVEERFEVVADEIEILGSSVLGLTLKCAQCHTHKYDPIPQRDYYRLVAVFQSAYDVYDWLKPTSVPNQSKQKNVPRRYLPQVSHDERAQWEAKRHNVNEQVAALRQKLAGRRDQLRAQHVEKELDQLPSVLREDLRVMLRTPSEGRSPVQSYLADKFEKRLTVTDTQLEKRHPELRKLKSQTDKQAQSLLASLPPEPMIRALWDRGDPSPTWIFRRGDFANPGNLVGPGVLSVLSDGKTPFVPEKRRPDSTGRRLAFAKWLTRPDHPLTARVLVNRVWFHHFGRGMIESLANFGKTGTPPSHPELLDWLAVAFVENGWSLKWLHRQILNSTAYQQASRLTDTHVELDPDNRLISRMPLRRLEAESVRDSLLAVAGRLDRNRFGPPDAVTVRGDGLVTAQDRAGGWRRTIYVQQRRKQLPTILETFDLPQMIPNCVERPNSMVAPQALHLLNNQWVRELASSFASRVQREAPSNLAGQVERIFEIALSRQPTPDERQQAMTAIQELTIQWKSALADGSESEAELKALANLCHVIMNSAAFLFVD